MTVFSTNKPALHSPHGLVTAQNTIAAAIGARVLAEGGNAVDAAVTTALALGVVEPWMSGIGGGGLMSIYNAREQTVKIIDFGMVSSTSLDPAAYPLVAGRGGDMFTWPRVKNDANVLGYKSICVPGAVDGLSKALEQFGTIGFDRALAPSIDLAEKGIEVNWFTTLVLATAAKELGPFPDISKTFLPKGHIPVAPANGSTPPLIRQPELAKTMRHLADNGPRAFYEGELAESLAKDVRDGGGFLTGEDLANYHARIVKALEFPYRDTVIHTTPGLSAGPTLKLALEKLALTLPSPTPLDSTSMLATIKALKSAYKTRFLSMGHAAEHNSCTSHLNVVDANGNMVALTNTLLSRFGSKVILPGSGILMNNAMMWFDPRPDNPNSIAPGVPPLCNMCPTIVTSNKAPAFALGAAGGRQIVSAVCQIISLITDHSLSLEEAINHPRFDMSGEPEVRLDKRLPANWIKVISDAMPIKLSSTSVYPVLFALVCAVSRTKDGLNTGAAEPSHPLAATIVEPVS